MSAAAPAPTAELALRATLRDLGAAAARIGAADLAHGFAALDERLRSRRLLVAVVGEHNRGKSSLINSLIGSVWLPVGQAAPALPPVYVSAGGREHVELVYDDGSAAESTRTELLSLDPDEAASLAYARVTLPSPDLHGLLLVDTPGLNDPDTTRLAQTVYGLLPQSDLALLVLDSAQALGASELELLESHIARAGLHRLVVVLNRDDELEDEAQRTAVRDRAARLLTPLLGQAPEILPYAARRALRARERKDARLLARSGYPELCALLQGIAAGRARIIQESVVARAQALGGTLLARLDAPPPVATPPAADEEGLAQRAAGAVRSLEDVRDRYLLDLRDFAIALRAGLADETAEIAIEDIRRFLPFYIQERFTAFLGERQEGVTTGVQQALREAGLDTLPLVPQAGRAAAPGLHPYMAPDFLEESILITTFMAVIGLTLRGAVAGAIMTLGPVVRMLTRDLRDRDERKGLLQTAQAATIEGGMALEGQIAAAFAETIDAVRTAAQSPVVADITIPVEDPVRLEARARVEAVLHALRDGAVAGDDTDES